MATQLGRPTAVVVTVGDRMVEPSRQRQMAFTLGAHVVELAGDHDVYLRKGSAYADAVLAGVDEVAARVRPRDRPADALPRPRRSPTAPTKGMGGLATCPHGWWPGSVPTPDRQLVS